MIKYRASDGIYHQAFRSLKDLIILNRTLSPHNTQKIDFIISTVCTCIMYGDKCKHVFFKFLNRMYKVLDVQSLKLRLM